MYSYFFQLVFLLVLIRKFIKIFLICHKHMYSQYTKSVYYSLKKRSANTPHGRRGAACDKFCGFISPVVVIMTQINKRFCEFCEFCVRLLYFLCAEKFISRKIRRTRRLFLKNNYIYRLRCCWNPQTLSQASPRRLAQWQLCLPHGSAVKLAHFCGLTCSFIAVKTLIKSSVYSANFA